MAGKHERSSSITSEASTDHKKQKTEEEEAPAAEETTQDDVSAIYSCAQGTLHHFLGNSFYNTVYAQEIFA